MAAKEDSQTFAIEGGKILAGKIPIYGAKNDALSLMAAALLFECPITLSNIPDIQDIKHMAALLSDIGVHVTHNKNARTITIDAGTISSYSLPKEKAEKIRASTMLIGPLLARMGAVTLPHPGGCVIGKRPIDYFVKGFRALGAHVSEKNNTYHFLLPKHVGGEVLLPFPSVTATETFITAAVLANGKTVIKNAAEEPEITNLVTFLQAGGADIDGKGTGTITIRGRNKKFLSHTDTHPFRVIPDRIEAGSFALLGALVGNPLRITGCNPNHLEQFLSSLTEAGASVAQGDDWIETKKTNTPHAVDIKTAPYPGFPTDLQAPFGIFLTQTKGKSLLFETVHDDRLRHLEDIKDMGADITLCDPQRAIIVGPTPLYGKNLKSPDLRAGLAFILAALVAKGESVIHNVYQIDRGYEKIEERLRSIGANIKRMQP